MTTKQVETKLVDVFTKDPFHGNSLVVVLYGESLSTEEKIAIIKEMNATKGVFVGDADDGKSDFKINLYTLEGEINADYHSLLGSAFVMVAEKHVNLKDGSTNILTIQAKQGIYPILVNSKSRDNLQLMIMLDWNEKPEFRRIEYDKEQVAEALGLSSDDFRHDLLIQAVKMGHWSMIIPVTDKEVFSKVILNRSKLFNLASENNVEFICLFYCNPDQPEEKIETKIFNPPLTHQTMLSSEDAITGESNPSIAAYLFENKLIPISGSKVYFNFIQKSSNERKGEITVEMTTVNENINEIYIGGFATIVLDGKMKLTAY